MADRDPGRIIMADRDPEIEIVRRDLLERAKLLLAERVGKLETIEVVESAVIAVVEGQNWTDVPLTDQEKDLIRMAARATISVTTMMAKGQAAIERLKRGEQ